MNKKQTIKNLTIVINQDNPINPQVLYSTDDNPNTLATLQLKQMVTLPQEEALEILAPHCKINISTIYKFFIDNILKINYPKKLCMTHIMQQMINNSHFKTIRKNWISHENNHDLKNMLYYLLAFIQEGLNQHLNALLPPPLPLTSDPNN